MLDFSCIHSAQSLPLVLKHFIMHTSSSTWLIFYNKQHLLAPLSYTY